AWVRVRPRPERRASAAVGFERFGDGAAAVRALSQSGLYPANCRLIDAREAATTGAGDGSRALLMLSFESADHDVEPWMSLALECCADHGGTWERRGGGSGSRADRVGSWREAFLRAPYLRDTFVAIGVLSETFETAITWERFGAFDRAVRARVTGALENVCGGGTLTCRFTHVYPDGPAPYYTILAPARRGEELEQWREIKRAASDAVIAHGGTITHHHAVGRAHRPWYDQQRPDAFALALRGAKGALDPARESTAEQVRVKGIHVRSTRLGDFTARPQATATLEESADVLLVATKASGLEPALERVVSAPRLVVPLLNGLDHMQRLRAHFDD